MSKLVNSILKKAKSQLAVLRSLSSSDKLYNGKKITEYAKDPAGYAKYVLKVELTPDQLAIAEAYIKPPYRVLCRAGHVVGKSFLSAFIVSWIYDTRPKCFIITTAPTLASVRDILWRELRKLRNRAGLGGFAGPKSLRLEDAPDHIAIGYTASSATSFQGKHELAVHVIIDEATGVEKEFWEAIETMLSGEEYGLLAIFNPTTTSCQAYQEEQEGTRLGDGTWVPRNNVFSISAINHPNITAELKGLSAPYPAAVRLSTLLNWIQKWCDRLPFSETPLETDFEFPFGTGIYYRPGPIFQARGLGRYPTTGIDTIWNESLIDICFNLRFEIDDRWNTTIGCDIARFGDDLTEMVVRIGKCIVHHESRSGWRSGQIAGRLKQLCREFAGRHQDPKQVQVFCDDTGGWGHGTIDQAGGYKFIAVNVSHKATDPILYYRVRTELWFGALECARLRLVDMTRLNDDSKKELKRQLMTQKYKILSSGQMWALDKDVIKKELGRSPDTADAFNLSMLTDYVDRGPEDV